MGERGGRTLGDVRRYAAMLGVVAAIGVAAMAAIGDASGVDGRYAAAFAVTTALSVWTPIRLNRDGGVQGFTLEGAVHLAMLFTLPLAVVPFVHTGAALVAHVALRQRLPKLAYNVGHLGIMSMGATLAFHAVGPGGEVLSARSLLAAAVAATIYDALDILQSAELFRRLEQRAIGASVRDALVLYRVTFVGNTAFGLLLAFLAVTDVVATLLAVPLMIGLYVGFRGYATAIEDGRRADRLHQVTQDLADAMVAPDATRRFLGDLASLLGADRARIVWFEGHETRVVSHPRSPVDRDETLEDDDPLSDALRRASAIERRGGVGGIDALAQPVVFEDRLVGAIAVYSRRGMEAWSSAHARLLATIAHEVAVALRNVELFAIVARERALLENESRKLADIVDAASDGIVMVGPSGAIALWNPAMEDLTRTPAVQVRGQPWYQAMRLRTPQGSELTVGSGSVIHDVLNGGPAVRDVDLQVLRPDGAWRWIRCSVGPLRRDEGHDATGVSGAVLVVRDVTREREVQDLKADFTATVSHELRTPLTPLRGFLETLRTRPDTLEPVQREAMVGAMLGQVARLENLVGDLLAVAAADRGLLGVRPQPIDLAAAVTDLLGREPWVRSQRRIRAHLPADVVVAIADHGAVQRILAALLDNAIKHTGGEVEIRVATDGAVARLEVEDEGPGIPEWEVDRIFDRFTRLGDHLRRTQGPGLGLSIARAYADELNGTITVRSDVARGSTFTVTLPMARRRTGGAAVAGGEASGPVVVLS